MSNCLHIFFVINSKKSKNYFYFEKVFNIFNKINLSYLNKIPCGVIHGDFSFSNLLFNKERISGILDFDNVCYSYLLTDVSRCQIFYAANEDNQIDIEFVEYFVNIYRKHREMYRDELLNFFNHLKLMLISATLDSYYHVNILRDRSNDRFSQSPFNVDTTDILLNKLLSIKDFSYLDVSKNHVWTKLNFYKNPPIMFLGLSGVGKTTLMLSLISQYNYYMPKLTTTRQSRIDDNPKYFEYVSQVEYNKSLNKDDIIFNTPSYGYDYGYKVSSFNKLDNIPLINCSVDGFFKNIDFPGIRVLIVGDFLYGLNLRGETIAKEREKDIMCLQSKISDQKFIEMFDIVFENKFGNILSNAAELNKKIVNLIDERRK